MNQCDLILVKGTGFISDTIEEITHSIYSHVAGYIGENDIIEAQGFEKTESVPLSKYDGLYDVFVCDTLTDEQKVGIVSYASGQIGRHYDYLLLVIELFRCLLHITLPYKESFKSNICSTLWCNAYRSVGIDLCPNIKYPSPKDISESKLLRKITTTNEVPQ